jgi:lysophospholipase L1-like esterase
VNMGKGGENTNQARARFKELLAQLPRYATIYYGLNDAAVDVWKGEIAPRVSIEQFTDNLRYFVRELKRTGATPILMTPNPLAWTAQQLELYGKPPYDPSAPDGHNVLVRAYAQKVRDLAGEEKVPLLDVFDLFEQCATTTGYAPLLLDGVHPSEFGHRLIADALAPLIKP